MWVSDSSTCFAAREKITSSCVKGSQKRLLTSLLQKRTGDWNICQVAKNRKVCHDDDRENLSDCFQEADRSEYVTDDKLHISEGFMFCFNGCPYWQEDIICQCLLNCYKSQLGCDNAMFWFVSMIGLVRKKHLGLGSHYYLVKVRGTPLSWWQ